MTEIFFIFLSCFMFFYLSSFGLSFFNKNRAEVCGSNFLNLSVNVIFFFNLIWFCSIFNLDKKFYFIFLIFLPLINLFFLFYYKYELKNFSNFYYLIFLLFFILSIVVAHDLYLGHDTRLYWFEKVLLFYNDFFVVDDKTIKPEYPHFGTYLWSFFWTNSVLKLEYFGRLSYLFLYLSAISFVCDKFHTNTYIKAILALIIISLTFEMKYFDGRQDILLFSINTIIFCFFHIILVEKKQTYFNFGLLLLCINLLLWTKTEGILYLLIYSFTIIIFAESKKKYFFLLSILLIFLIKIYFYIYYELSLNPSRDMYDSNTISMIFEISILDRSLSIFYWYFISLVKTPLLIMTFFLYLFFCFKSKDFFLNYKYLSMIFALLFVGIFFSYLPTKYDFPFAMIGGLDRVLFQHASLFLLPVLSILKKFLLIKN